MTYNQSVLFIETTHFTSLVKKYLTDDEYRELQQYLISFPDAGDIIRGSGGVRKLRWARPGTGKSGGLRIIYYWAKRRDQIYMLTLYSKSELENISAEMLAKIAKQLETI